MQTVPSKLKPAQEELQRTAHDQDLIEIPKRARLDREAENDGSAQMTLGAGQVNVTNL